MGTSARAQALAKAADAVARRDAERIAREKAVQEALAEFFQAQGEVERIHAAAAMTAAPFDAMMREALRALERLGETRTGIGDLTGVPVARVRDYLADDGTTVAQDQPSRARARSGRPSMDSTSGPDAGGLVDQRPQPGA